jgi:hypothetical protein
MSGPSMSGQLRTWLLGERDLQNPKQYAPLIAAVPSTGRPYSWKGPDAAEPTYPVSLWLAATGDLVEMKMPTTCSNWPWSAKKLPSRSSLSVWTP